jgi:hypothetical protein
VHHRLFGVVLPRPAEYRFAAAAAGTRGGEEEHTTTGDISNKTRDKKKRVK